MWRGHLALVLCRRQDAGGTQGRDGLATNYNRDETATQQDRWNLGGSLNAAGFGDGREYYSPAKHVLVFAKD